MTVYRLYLDLEMLKERIYFAAWVMESGVHLSTPTCFKPNKLNILDSPTFFFFFFSTNSIGSLGANKSRDRVRNVMMDTVTLKGTQMESESRPGR